MTTDKKKIILFELNEVPYRVVDDFVKRSPKSALAKILKKSEQLTTVSEEQSHLSPWKTWPSLHRGVNDAKHKIMDFGQDVRAIDKLYPPIWSILASEGLEVGVFGSLHTHVLPKNLLHYAFFLPDTFAPDERAWPNILSVFQRFNLSMARGSTRNVSRAVNGPELLRFLKALWPLGIRPSTLVDVGRQLVHEVIKPWTKNRRRTYQAVLGFDVFMKQLQETRPDFVTFFTNHVASAMHRYWAAAYSNDYEQNEFSKEWIETYKNEIHFAMSKADEMLARLLEFCETHSEYELWIASSMGQAAISGIPIKTQLELQNPTQFFKKLGVSTSNWESRPAMFPNYNFFVKEGREQLRARLSQVLVNGSPIQWREAEEGFFSVDFGHGNVTEQNLKLEYVGKSYEMKDLGLGILVIEDESGSSAYHIPEGILIVQSDGIDRSSKRERISSLEVAPKILSKFGLAIPIYMKNGRPSALSDGLQSPESLL